MRAADPLDSIQLSVSRRLARLPLEVTPVDLGPEDLDQAKGILCPLIDVFQGAAWQALVTDLAHQTHGVEPCLNAVA